MTELLRRLLNLPAGASTYALDVDHLHFAVIGVTMAGSMAALGTAVFFAFRYQRRAGDGPTPEVKAPLWLEIGWATGLLFLFFGFWVVGFSIYMRIEVPPAGAMDVYVTGKQWMWKFEYPDGNATISDLVIPAGRAVRLIMTSRDVIHSFYVPAFRMKQDVVPGRYTTAWFEAPSPGTFRIFCAEYCGTGHSRMWGQVEVLSAHDYQRWQSGHAPEGVPLVERGRDAAARHGCLSCHTLDGQSHIGPTWRGLFGSTVRLADGRSVVADASYLTRSMMDPGADVVRGFAPVMPTYQGQIDPADTAAILELIRDISGPQAARAQEMPDMHQMGAP